MSFFWAAVNNMDVGVLDWDNESRVDAGDSWQTGWLQVVVAGAAMLVLGATFLYSVYAMRQVRWEARGWGRPEPSGNRGLPSGAMHLRLHTLRTDAEEADLLVKAVKRFPPAMRPLPVAMDPASEKLVALLRREGRPVTVIGPGRALFRVYHRPPLDEEHRALYGEGLDWSDVHEAVTDLEAAVGRAVGNVAPLRTVLYAMPEDGEAASWTFPFEVATSATFAEAYAAARGAGDRLTLLALHSDVSGPGCP